MIIYPNQYYHLFNRSNNNELVFKSRENYLYFLRKYRHYFDGLIDTIGYCLMPTHFHFFIFIIYENIELIKSRIGIWQSSYTKAINKKFERHGSLFQHHSKAKHVDDESYLITLLTYIHQNPVRSNLVAKAEDWEFSSYRDYIDLRKGTLLNKTVVKGIFPTVEELKEFTEKAMIKIEEKYWV